MSDETRHVAVHESGHALVAWRLGWRVRGITCVPGRRWAGSMHYGRPAVRGRDWARLDVCINTDRPVMLWPAAVRRDVEVRACVAAAGDVATRLLFWATDTPGRPPEPAYVALNTPSSPAVRDLARLVAGESRSDGDTDLELLDGLSRAVYPADLDTRIAWLRWIDATACELVAAGAGRVERLAAVAVDKGRLSGSAVRTILTNQGSTT